MERRPKSALFSQSAGGYITAFVALFLVGVTGLAFAWAAVDQKPDGRAVLMKMADYLSKSPAWSVTVHTAYDAVQPDGFKVEWNGVRTIALKRPDRVRVESERSDGARSLVLFDGKQITTFDEPANVYARITHPGSVDDAVVYFVHDLGMRLPLAMMLLDRMSGEMQQRVQAAKYVEKTSTLGVPAHHIAAKTPTVDFQVWVAEGDRPVPMRAVLTYKNSPGQPQFRADFSDWNFDIQPSEALFAFTPPAGAKEIPFAASLLNIGPARQGSASRMQGGNR
jgi:hypothetical protein